MKKKKLYEIYLFEKWEIGRSAGYCPLEIRRIWAVSAQQAVDFCFDGFIDKPNGLVILDVKIINKNNAHELS